MIFVPWMMMMMMMIPMCSSINITTLKA